MASGVDSMKAKQWAAFLILTSLTSASAFAADSTGLSTTLPAASGGTGIQSYYPDQSTSPSVTTGSVGAQYYDNLPNCPGDPTASSAPPTPICPDINNIWQVSPTSTVRPGQNAITTQTELNTYCPDVCQTNRKVVTGTPITNGSTTYTPVTSMTPAICPAGYVQIGASTSGPDIQYNASVGTPIQVNNDAEYQSYASKGYSCGELPNVPQTITTYCSYNAGFALTNTETNNCDASKVGTPQLYLFGSTPKYGILKSCPSYTKTDIAAGNASCKIQGVSKCGMYMGTNSDGLCNDFHAILFVNRYSDIYCTPPAGYYYTTDTVPTKLACARVKSVWQKRY